MKKTSEDNKTPNSLQAVWNEVKRRMTIAGYRKKTIIGYKCIVKRLSKYMTDNDYVEYSPTVGSAFQSANLKIVTCPSLVNHLNIALTDVFWGTYYDTNEYTIVNSNLQKMLDLMCADYDAAGINKSSKKNIIRCVRLLDIYMRENKITEYIPEVGKQFLQNIGKPSRVLTCFYNSAISKLNIYVSGEHPFFKRNTNYKFHNEELKDNLIILVNILSDKKYKNIDCVFGVISQLDQYMWRKNITSYSPFVGEKYIEFCQQHSASKERKPYAAFIIAHFNDVIMNRPFQKNHNQKEYSMPDGFLSSFQVFYEACVDKGDTSSTLYKKSHICYRFFSELVNAGISNIREITPDAIIETCAKVNCSDWNCIRMYLRCCALNNFTAQNYAYYVPHEKSRLLIPPYYTKEERLRLEAAPNRDIPLGKRDYAIILLANRLGLQSGDIANLSFKELQHGEKIIDFEQMKTKVPHNLPLLPEIEAAVMDYVNNGRPESDSEKVFLCPRAPHDPITRKSIYYAVTKYFRLAGVDISGRKHGAHALRASLGTDLVNNGFSYNETKHILGHRDANSTRHYAVIDINNLRPCAGRPNPPRGNFAKILYGEKEKKDL